MKVSPRGLVAAIVLLVLLSNFLGGASVILITLAPLVYVND